MIALQVARLAALAALGGLCVASESASALSFTAVEAGNSSSCGISQEQQLWCWGGNGAYVLGTDHSIAFVAPYPQPVGLSDVTAVSAHERHVCAIAGGEAWCWGSNSKGQLGVGPAASDQSVPVRVAGVLSGRTDVSAIGVGSEISCALANGHVYCWGRGDGGQLGDGTATSAGLPTQALIAGATVLAVGYWHACAIAQGSVWCWGDGSAGQLGNGAYSNSAVPTAVMGLPAAESFERLALGDLHSCAIAAGKAWCWGSNGYGQLGTGDSTPHNVAVPVMWNQQAAIVDIAAGAAHSCAIDSEGGAWCWGKDVWGQLGDDCCVGHKQVPTRVYPPFALNVTALSAGIDHTCGVAGGVAHCWGRNTHHQLGALADLAFVPMPAPVNVDRVFDSGFEY